MIYLTNYSKDIVYSVRLPLEIIYNKSLSEGVFPDLMKIAKIKPLHKCEDVRICDNYRPISLLPVLSKVLEKIVYTRLSSHMEKNDILYSKQYGFRPKMGTEDAIANLIGEIIEGQDNNLSVIGVFIDLKKAFDTVSHEIILKKLERMGIRGTSLNWFMSYLSN